MKNCSSDSVCVCVCMCVCVCLTCVCVQVYLQVSALVTRVLQVDNAIVVRLDTEIFLYVSAVSVTCGAASTLTPAGPANAR